MLEKGWVLAVAVLPLCLLATARATPSQLPARVEAQLVAKAVEYDRQQASVTGTYQVLLAARRGDSESVGHARLLAHELAAMETIAGRPHREEIIVVDDAREAVEQIKKRDASIVYLSTGLEDEVEAIASGLTGHTALTIGGVPGYALLGAVLGIEAVSGRVELVVNLAQSRKQNVDFRAAFLSLARVIR